MAEDYTYAVARIRALENSLFSDGVIDQLIACRDEAACIHFLEERGWGDADSAGDGEAILAREEEKIWEVVRDLHIDMKLFDVLSLPKEFHNLKAAVKVVYESSADRGADGAAGTGSGRDALEGRRMPAVYYEGLPVSGEELEEIIRERDFDRLPDDMRSAAEEAYDTLMHTGDGQACDIIIDRACLASVLEAGRKAGQSGNHVIRDYAETIVSVADIRTAVRAARTGKSQDFLMKALVDTESLSSDALAKSSVQGEDAVREYLMTTDYRDAVEYLSKSPSAFEKWCDDKITESLDPQKYEAFTIGPVIAYVIARQNEIKTVRLIMTGKANGLPEDSIRERVRRMYV
ncbi:MAG: V-type ATPase subunit [Eubacterium sp.]|nr:V-type ATPase subunit [Eubacterium sp.]